MSDKSGIEWTDATWNPVTGCTKISHGCDNCYAETFAERWRGLKDHHYEQGFDLKLWPDRMSIPLRWSRPRKIFVNSMSDLFHKDVPSDFIEWVFSIMKKCPLHTFQVLTKRSERMKLFNWRRNMWAGTSVESKNYQFRIDRLRETNAETKFLSLEPLLGPLDNLNLDSIGWVIVGGESGPGARPMEESWVREIRDQCIEQSVPFFFKQWGGVNKKKTGRLLDGREYNEMPKDKVLA